jgi:hypothetical protein
MRSFSALAALVLTLTLAAAAPVAAREQRPMHGQFSASVAVAAEQRCGPDALTLAFTASGGATHLGRITGSGTNCTEFTLATSAVAIWDGMATYEAADGSSILIRYEGTQDAPVAGIASTSAIHTVIGGTGRFSNAAGAWMVTGQIDFLTASFDGEFAGWLSY